MCDYALGNSYYYGVRLSDEKQREAAGLQNKESNKARVQARVAEVLALVNLSGLEQRYSHELSGGQQ